MKVVKCVLVCLALLVITVLPCSAEEWAITYGDSTTNEFAYSIQQTVPDGGYIIAGPRADDFSALKLNPDGSIAWQKKYPGISWDFLNSIRQTVDGGYIAAGTSSFGTNPVNAYVLKLNPDGSIAWQEIYDGGLDEYARSIQQTFPDGGYVVAGMSECGLGQADLWVSKLNPNGDIVWKKCYGGGGSDQAFEIQQTADGGYIVAGRSFVSFDTWDDFWVLKLDSLGTVEWEKSFGGSKDDQAYSIKQTADGGYIVAGWTKSFGAGFDDAWVLKLNSAGGVVWQKAYGGSCTDRASSVHQTSEGGYVVAGYTCSFSVGMAHFDFWLLNLNPDGTIRWQKTYGGVDHDFAYSLQPIEDGGYLLAGKTESFGAGGSDFFLLKLDENGEIPDCGIIGTSSAVVTTTTAVTETTDATMQESSVTATDSEIPKQDTSIQEAVICYSSDDTDDDGVPDDKDECPDTVIPESVPTKKLGTNRFALVDGDTIFDTETPKGKGPRKSFSIEDSAGCSCEQIIDQLGLGKGHTKFGCSISAMEDWVNQVKQ